VSVSFDEMFAYIKRLSEAVGPSGYEHDVRGIVVDLVRDSADKLWTDTLGNVVALKGGREKGLSLMIAAHMDEIGLFVSHIDDNGFIRVQPIGGIHERALAFQRVIVKTRSGKSYRGVIGFKPPHAAKPEEARQIPEMRELFVDVGAKSREEVKNMGIDVGDVIVFERDVAPLGSSRITGKAFDDRVGLAVAVKAFQLIENNEIDVYFVATVQEEVGLKGARTSAYSITPSLALAIDTTVANDIPSISQHEWCTALGHGPAIKIADGRSASGIIVPRDIVDKLIEVASSLGIPYQLEVLPGGTTDASIIQLNKEGVPAGTVSIPTRYLHSSVEVVDMSDVINTVKLVKGFAESVSGDWVNRLRGKIIK